MAAKSWARFGGALYLWVFVILLQGVSPALAGGEDAGRFTRGFMSTTTGAFELPFHVVNSTLTQPFPLGVVDGVLRGSILSVSKIVGGLFDMGAAAAPLAKYAVFFL